MFEDWLARVSDLRQYAETCLKWLQHLVLSDTKVMCFRVFESLANRVSGLLQYVEAISNNFCIFPKVKTTS